MVRISSDRPLNEPFVDMMVELAWANGRLIREYTFLLDPAQGHLGKTGQCSGQPAVRQAPPPAAAASSPRPCRRGSATRAIASSAATRSIASPSRRAEGVSLDQMLVALFRANPPPSMAA